MLKYAFAHPGKIGDALYSLPVIKYLCIRDNAVADFYTSEYCRPLERLIKYQSEIQDFIIPKDYVLQRLDCGGQPWEMPIPGNYDKVFQLGFRHHPPRGPLHQFIAKSIGEYSPEVDQFLNWSAPEISLLDTKYIAIAPRGEAFSQTQVLRELCRVSSIPVVQIGLRHEYIDAKSINMTGLDILETMSILRSVNCVGFVGYMSSPMVYANGVPWLRKIGLLPHTNAGEEHGVFTKNNKYLINPTVEQLVETLELNKYE